MTKDSNASGKEESLYGWMIYKFFPYWPLFAGLLFLGSISAWLYLQYKEPVYQASAKVIIKDEKKGVEDSQIMEAMNPFASNKIVENEIEVIRSREIMTQVVMNLMLYAPVFEDKQLKSFSEFASTPFQGLKATSAYSTSPLVVEVRYPEEIKMDPEKPSEFYFSYDPINKKVEVGKKIFPIDKWVESEEFGEIKFRNNTNQTQDSEGHFYFTLIHPKGITNMLLNRLNVEAGDKLSTVVNLKFKDPVPLRAEDILNHLIIAYNQAAVSHQNQFAQNTLAFIDERMQEVEAELIVLEKEIQQYRSNEGVIDLSEQGKLYLRDVGNNDRDIADLELQLTVLDNVEDYLVSKKNTSGLVPSTVGLNDPVLRQLLDKLYESEIKYEQLKKTTAENNPILLSVANEIQKIRPSILENVRDQRANLQGQLKSLSSSNREYTSTLRTLPEKERTLLEISRRKIIKGELFSFLLQKREETALSYAPAEGDSRIVDKAQASINPVSPKPLTVFAIAILLATGAGVGFVSIKDMSNKILYGYELEEYTNIPVIGELPVIQKPPKLSGTAFMDKVTAQKFNDLRIVLGLYGKKPVHRKILVTSSMEGEGKSFVCEHLALALSTSGKKAILVNFDLRKPDSVLFSGTGDNPGVVDHLTQGMDPSQLIVPSKHENLFLLGGGKYSESNSQLIVNGEITSLFVYLEKNYDFILVDTPPIGAGLDACVLSKYCDLTLFAVRHGQTPKWIIKHLDQNKNMQQLINPHIIFNGIKKRGIKELGYGYGYGFDYGYKNASVIKKVS